MYKETKGKVCSGNDYYNSVQNILPSHLCYEDMKTKLNSSTNLPITITLQNILKLLAVGLPVPLSFLASA